METTELPQSLRRVLDRFIWAFSPERIVLFGSYAKGTNRPDSDVDLLIITDLFGDPGVTIRRARQLAANCFPSVDVAFATPEEVACATIADNPFLASIVGSGISVYQREPRTAKKFR